MIYCETNNYFFPVSVKEIFLYKLDFWVRDGGHVDHVSACIEHDVALKRVVMYPHVIEHVSSYIEHGPSFCTLEVVWYEKNFWMKKESHVSSRIEHVSTCIEHDVALKRLSCILTL